MAAQRREKQNEKEESEDENTEENIGEKKVGGGEQAWCQRRRGTLGGSERRADEGK